jgi:hypothetical protein
MTKPTAATLRALAFTYLTGHKPKGIHVRTHCALGEMVTFQCDYRYIQTGRFYEVKPEYLELAEGQPLVRAARHLESLGYRIEPYCGRSYAEGISMVKVSEEGSKRDAYAWQSGRWSISYGCESGQA